MKSATLVLLWLLGSATAIGVAWSGVGVLDEELVAPAPATTGPTAAEGLISEAVDGETIDGPNPSDEPSATSATSSTSSTSSIEAKATTSSVSSTLSNRATEALLSSTSTSTSTSSSASTTATSAPTSSTAGPTRSSTTTTGPPSTTTTTPSTTTTTQPSTVSASPATTTSTGSSETKTFTLIGGTTAIKFTPSQTKVLWATPNAGYEVRIDPDPSEVRVEFRGEDHRSRIDAWWENGPRWEIREDPD